MNSGMMRNENFAHRSANAAYSLCANSESIQTGSEGPGPVVSGLFLPVVVITGNEKTRESRRQRIDLDAGKMGTKGEDDMGAQVHDAEGALVVRGPEISLARPVAGIDGTMP